jgi:hypothetical protein
MDQIRFYPKKVFCVIASFAMNSEDVYIADGRVRGVITIM